MNFHRPIRLARPVTLTLLLALLACLSASAQEWKTYSHPEDGFRVTMPTAPELSKQNVGAGDTSFELRMYASTIGDNALFVGVCDYGDKATGLDRDNLLQAAKNGAISNAKAKLLSEKKITLGENKGIEFEGEAGSLHLIERTFMVGNILYQTVVVFPTAKPYPDTTRFLNSFELIARTAH